MTRAETRYSFSVMLPTTGPKETEAEAQATVSPHFIVTRLPKDKQWKVTHVWTLRSVTPMLMPLRKARLVAAVFGALPIAWENVTEDNAREAWKAHASDWTEWRKSL